jgi:hypothetical protein
MLSLRVGVGDFDRDVKRQSIAAAAIDGHEDTSHSEGYHMLASRHGDLFARRLQSSGISSNSNMSVPIMGNNHALL